MVREIGMRFESEGQDTIALIRAIAFAAHESCIAWNPLNSDLNVRYAFLLVHRPNSQFMLQHLLVWQPWSSSCIRSRWWVLSRPSMWLPWLCGLIPLKLVSSHFYCSGYGTSSTRVCMYQTYIARSISGMLSCDICPTAIQYKEANIQALCLVIKRAWCDLVRASRQDFSFFLGA